MARCLRSITGKRRDALHRSKARPQAASSAKQSNEKAALDSEGLNSARTEPPRNAMTSRKGLTGGNPSETKQLLLDSSLRGNVDGVKTAIKLGANVNAKTTDEGQTALHIACYKAHPEVVKVLLNQTGIDVNQVNRKGYLPLQLTLDTPNNTALTNDTALTRHTKKLECCRLLLRHEGIDVNAGRNDKNPLHTAISDHLPLDIIKDLLRNNCDFWSKDNYGSTAIALAISEGSFDVYSLLRDHEVACEKITDTTLLLVLAAMKEDPRFLRDLIGRGANVNATDINGCTPIFFSVLFDRDSTITELVRLGALVDVKDEFGVTPLMRAASLECYRSIAALVSAGADPNCTDNSGRALYDICQRNSEIKRVVDEALRNSERVPKMVKPSDPEAACSICLEKLSERTEKLSERTEKLSERTVIQLDCKHEFHDLCIRPWLGEHSSCPSCRGYSTPVEKR